MTTREAYVSKMKEQLDRWNTELSGWEAKAKDAQEEARKRYTRELEELRVQREKALYQLKLVEGASASAWTDLVEGADKAWEHMSAAIARARTHFAKTEK